MPLVTAENHMELSRGLNSLACDEPRKPCSGPKRATSIGLLGWVELTAGRIFPVSRLVAGALGPDAAKIASAFLHGSRKKNGMLMVQRPGEQKNMEETRRY